MLLKNYKITFLQQLSSLYDEQEIESCFNLVLEDFHQIKRIDLALNPKMELDSTQLQCWESVLTELKMQKPIQYILGKTEFFGLPFLVNENVLIPRPETEELVEMIIKNTKKRASNTKLKILDIGTGSGCIAISLAKNIPNAVVYAIDVCEKALAVAKKNAEINKIAIDFILNDILTTTDLEQQFDVIVSNPPYVRNLEKHEILPNVLEYEPHLALFVEDDDALLFYKKIAQLALKNLTENGQLYFEINQYLANETFQLLESLGFQNIELKKDIYQNDRMISCSYS